MLKKTVPIIMALALCAALTACSSGGSSSGSSSPKFDGSSPSPAPSDAKLVRIESGEKKVDCTVSGDKITLKDSNSSKDDFYDREYWYYPGTVKNRLRSGFDEYDAALTGALSPSDYAALGIGNILSEKTDEFTKTYEYFDAEGKCVMSETGSGETYTYEYDANGVYTKEYTTYEDGDTSTPDVYDCEYDNSGKLLKVSDSSRWVEYKYDGDGNIASVSCQYEGDNDIEGVAEYEYSDGRLAKKTFYKINDGEKTLNRWYDYSYDDAGHLTEIADNAGSRDDQGSASE